MRFIFKTDYAQDLRLARHEGHRFWYPMLLLAWRLGTRRWQVVLVGAWTITAWDLFLDPQMVGEGYWQWQPASLVFRGIPLVNYAGWFATALINSALVTAICRAPHGVKPRLSIATYATLTILSTIGFVFFFDDFQ